MIKEKNIVSYTIPSITLGMAHLGARYMYHLEDGIQLEMCNCVNYTFGLSSSNLPFEFSLRGIPID